MYLKVYLYSVVERDSGVWRSQVWCPVFNNVAVVYGYVYLRYMTDLVVFRERERESERAREK